MSVTKINALQIKITSGVRSIVKDIDLMNISCHDIIDEIHANELAVAKTELTGDLHIVTTQGREMYITRVPKVGDEVSYCFNGDAYPAGNIVSVSKTFKVVTTSNGDGYYRKGNTGSWVRKGCWSLIQGNHDYRNPHF